jgi:hypothetical protein
MTDEDAPRPAYSWGELVPTEMPSPELIPAVDGADVRYFKAAVVGSCDGRDWPTKSSVELAYVKDSGAFRALWKSGIGDTPELPGVIISDWSNAPTREDAMVQFFNRQEAAGTPLLGVCEVTKVRKGTTRYRDAPIVYGYEFE